MRIPKSFTIEPDISRYLDETQGERSASNRLATEAREFFAHAQIDRATKAFLKASLRTFDRD
jgi:hypothetical protein